jgi:hypothetical protein
MTKCFCSVALLIGDSNYKSTNELSCSLTSLGCNNIILNIIGLRAILITKSKLKTEPLQTFNPTLIRFAICSNTYLELLKWLHQKFPGQIGMYETEKSDGETWWSEDKQFCMLEFVESMEWNCLLQKSATSSA